ncbi:MULTISPECIES: polysaccharide biosynthesis/export family protein [unclassified Pseudovibrio]|uniref:polysaccharide biosynthesis/export family protein n=1 Tax=unclassified Pseudovibrio TaxID=2627060 RepID=UPI0007AE3A9D|nr:MULTISPECIES: polysaccharide biosynthesis/export family protein [unclassified Pseudovibrio]KZL03827.1 Polysaccharide biosynthesis/export protein [Pseudovibrio sp. W74]KZL09778.1 Polysaccharide biosynthesis/export protein [Pseudovibrio sp. Ad14]
MNLFFNSTDVRSAQVYSGFFKSIAIIAPVLGMLSGCAALPSAGPVSSEIQAASSDRRTEPFDYHLIDLDDSVVSVLSAYQPNGLSKVFTGGKWAPKHIVGVGDTVSVVVWEQGNDRLFTPDGQAGGVELGPFMVNQSGAITIPYVGKVNARGKSVERLQEALQVALDRKATNPQVIVTLEQNASSLVTVNGSVKKPGQYPLDLSGKRLLDVVANAGGNASPATESYVSISRNGRQAKQLLSTVFQTTDENVYVRPGDRIFVTHDPQTFTAFGAVPKVGEYPIQASNVSLVEALGRIGGLDQNAANSQGLFVFRYEDPQVISQLKSEYYGTNSGKVPVIYRLNMRDARSYFKGQLFSLRDKDVVYVSSAYGTELNKFIRILSGTLAISKAASTF